MKKLLISFKRVSWSFLLGSAILLGATACSTGTSDGQVNVEESDFKDKSPTEHNPPGLSDNTQDNGGKPVPGAMTSDSAYEEVYDQQVKKGRQRNGEGGGNQAFGGAANTNKDNQ